MRVIRHRDTESPSRETNLASGVFLIINFPVLLLREKFFFRVMVSRDIKIDNRGNHVFPRGWIRVLNNVIIVFIITSIALILVAGVAFVLYVLKSFLGWDLFPFEHLL